MRGQSYLAAKRRRAMLVGKISNTIAQNQRNNVVFCIWRAWRRKACRKYSYLKNIFLVCKRMKLLHNVKALKEAERHAYPEKPMVREYFF